MAKSHNLLPFIFLFIFLEGYSQNNDITLYKRALEIIDSSLLDRPLQKDSLLKNSVPEKMTNPKHKNLSIRYYIFSELNNLEPYRIESWGIGRFNDTSLKADNFLVSEFSKIQDLKSYYPESIFLISKQNEIPLNQVVKGFAGIINFSKILYSSDKALFYIKFRIGYSPSFWSFKFKKNSKDLDSWDLVKVVSEID